MAAARGLPLRRAGKGGLLASDNSPPSVIGWEGLTMKHATEANTGSENSILAGFIAPGELCRQLGKTRRTLDRWHARGLGPPRIVIQRMILYRVQDVRSWLEAHIQRRELRQGQGTASAAAGGGK